MYGRPGFILCEVIDCDYYYAGPGQPQDIEVRMACGHTSWLVERSDRKYPSDWIGAMSRCFQCAEEKEAQQ